MAERTTICKKVYVDSEGNETSHASPNVDRLEFRFANGTVLAVSEKDVGDGCRKAAFFHGLAQKIGDSYAGVKGDTTTAIENASTVIERLMGDDWVKQGEGIGARPSLVVDAVIAALEEAGETVSDDRRKAIMEKVKGKEGREGALANPVINAHYERIKAARQAERAAKAAAAAQGKELELGDF